MMGLKIKRASEIDDLYEKVRDYDLVLTVEAPLADALNNRLERSKLGEFAITPKRLAYGVNRNREIADERQLFVEVVQRTGLSWKQAFYLLENVLSCWKNTGALRKILDYKQYDNSNTRKVIKILEETYNVYGAMEDFEPGDWSDIFPIEYLILFKLRVTRFFKGKVLGNVIYTGEKEALNRIIISFV